MDIDKNETEIEEYIDINNNQKIIDNTTKKKKVKLRFRNYQPKCKKLKKYCIEPAKFIEIDDEFKELIEKSQKIDYDNIEIAPKKINWDLKREIKPEMDQLHNLTQIALRQIIQDKIDKEGNNEQESSEYETDDDSNDDSNDTNNESDDNNSK